MPMSNPAIQTMNKDRKTDRIIVVKPKAGQKPMSSTGLVDPRIFTGENKLHAIKSEQNNLWSLKLEAGGLAEPLKQKFSNFPTLLNFVRQYFEKRNLEVTEVID